MIKLLGEKIIKAYRLIAYLLVVIAVGAGLLIGNPNTNAGKRGSIYANPNASGVMTGEKNKPYKSIQQAINRADEENKDVILQPGTYYENDITITGDVALSGYSRDSVIIDGNDYNKTVIKMKDDAKLENVTVKGGKRGVEIEDDAEAVIWECRIERNWRDGIKIEAADTVEKRKVDIFNTIIAYNGWNGIYSEKRMFYLEDNEIYENSKDGIEFAKDSEGTIKDTKIKDNRGVGLKLVIDESNINIKDVTIKDNDKSGVEIWGKGEKGWIYFDKKTKIRENEDYGIIRLEGGDYGDDYWKDSLNIDEDVDFNDNGCEKDVSDLIITDCDGCIG